MYHFRKSINLPQILQICFQEYLRRNMFLIIHRMIRKTGRRLRRLTKRKMPTAIENDGDVFERQFSRQMWRRQIFIVTASLPLVSRVCAAKRNKQRHRHFFKRQVMVEVAIEGVSGSHLLPRRRMLTVTGTAIHIHLTNSRKAEFIARPTTGGSSPGQSMVVGEFTTLSSGEMDFLPFFMQLLFSHAFHCKRAILRYITAGGDVIQFWSVLLSRSYWHTFFVA